MADTRNRMTNAQRETVAAAILEIAEAERPITVRGLFYRVMSRGLVPKTERGYSQVQKLTLKLRRTGELPYGWIADSSRRRITLRAYNGLDEALNATARFYRRRFWSEQNLYVEVWTEKDAITGVIEDTTLDWDVPLVVARGYASETFLWEAAEQIEEVDKPTFIYQLGDHDRDGVQAFDKTQERLRDLVPSDIDLTFQRIAVTPAQITGWNLPTRPDKTGSGFGDCVEVDAIDSNTLRELVTDAIEQHVDFDAYEALKVAERSEREILHRIAGEYGDSDDGATERSRRRAERERKLQRKLQREQIERKLREARKRLAEADRALADYQAM